MNELSSPPGSREPDEEAALRELIASARVVVFCSNLTDVRPIMTRLDRLGVPRRLVVMGMGSLHMRRRFHALESLTGWKLLPQIFVDGRFLGGYEEFFAHDFAAAGDAVPAPAAWLGTGGLVPFVAGALGMWLAPPSWRSEILSLLLIYAAMILSFLGAVHWGLALRDGLRDRALWRRLGLSVSPALAAWFALMTPAFPALTILILTFAAMYVVDRAMLDGIVPHWYPRLRGWLSAGVLFSLLAALLTLTPAAAPVQPGMQVPEYANGQDTNRERGDGAALAEPLRAPHRSVVF